MLMDPSTLGQDVLKYQDSLAATCRQMSVMDLSNWNDLRLTVTVVYRAFSDDTRPVPYHVRSGPRRLSEDGRRKWIRGVVLHKVGAGSGTVTVRIWADNKEFQFGIIDMGQNPQNTMKLALPRGTCAYTVDLEVCGTAPIRHAEIEWEDMEWEP